MIALLGILKSGGAYTPIDPDWPAARQQQVIGELGLRVVVCGEEELEERETNPKAERPDGGASGVCAVHVGVDGAAERVMVRQSSVVKLWSGLRERIYGAGERRSESA